jgi:peptidoglycan-associated lipoprotein
MDAHGLARVPCVGAYLLLEQARGCLPLTKGIVVCSVVSVAMLYSGCKKKVAVPLPQKTPTAVQAPTRTLPSTNVLTIRLFEAEPTSIQYGQSSTLRWEISGDVSNASIDQGVGTVSNAGNRQVFPRSSTTYTLVAGGMGGSATASATIRVSLEPPALVAPTPQPQNAFVQRVASDLPDAFFAYGKSNIRADAGETLIRNVIVLTRIINDFPNSSIVIEGHCDERGSAEYNMGLGDERARSVKDYLVQFGVPAGRLKTISYGKERPQCVDSNEVCWQKNRRVHFSAQ